MNSELSHTLIQMGRNAWQNPSQFVGQHGLGASRAYLSQQAQRTAKALQGVRLIPPHQRPDITESYRHGDRAGSYCRDHVELSPEARELLR